MHPDSKTLGKKQAHMTRIPIEETFLNLAFEWARRSTCSDRLQVGCVLVNQYNQVIASGYNGAPRGFPHCDEVGCDDDGHSHRVIHAEENAILQAAYTGISTKGSAAYVTHLPCYRCALRIIQAGIIQVTYVLHHTQSRRAIETLAAGEVKLLHLQDFFENALITRKQV